MNNSTNIAHLIESIKGYINTTLSPFEILPILEPKLSNLFNDVLTTCGEYLRQERQQFQLQKSEFEKSFEEERKLLEEKIEELNKIALNHEDLIDSVKNSHLEEVRALKTQQNERVRRLQANHKRALKNKQKEVEASMIKAHELDLKKTMKRTKLTTTQKIEKELRKVYASQTKELQHAIGELKRKDEEFSTTIAAQRTSLEQQILELQTRVACLKMDLEKSELQAEKLKKDISHKNTLLREKEKEGKEVLILNQQRILFLEDSIARLREESERWRNELKLAQKINQDQVEDFKIKLNEKSEVQTEMQVKHEEEIVSLEKRIREVLKRREDAHSKNISELRKTYESRIRSLVLEAKEISA